jgi:hypothetical protein
MLQAKIVRKQILSTFLPAAWAFLGSRQNISEGVSNEFYGGGIPLLLFVFVFFIVFEKKKIFFDCYSLSHLCDIFLKLKFLKY